MLLLSITDAAECSGYSKKQIRNICEAGLLIPEEGGSGKGCHRMFSIVQAVALAYCCRFAGTGASREIIHRLFDQFLDLSEDKLLNEFDAGRTHCIPRVDGPPVFTQWDGPHGELFDVKSLYEGVIARIQKIQAENRDGLLTGRLRGLQRRTAD